jgi:hypothetical protein
MTTGTVLPFYVGVLLALVSAFGPSAQAQTKVRSNQLNQADNYAWTGNNSHTGSEKFGSINNILFVDGVSHATLSSALSACVTSCWIIDTLPETFSSNPFTGFSSLAKIDFGAGTWTLNAQVIVPSNVSLFTGSGRSGSGATIFKAGGSMPASMPLIKALGTQGQVLSRLVVDCSSVSGSSGILATDWNENSGIEKVLVINCPAFEVNVDATAFASIPAQNYFIRDLEAFPQSAGSGTTVAVHLKGNGGGGPGEVANVTANGSSGHTILSSIQVENWNQAIFRNIHGEFATNVWQNTSSAVSSFLIDNVTGTATDTNIVNVNAASTANDFIIRRVSTGGATNSIVDGPRSTTLTDSTVTLYSIGGGAIGSEDIYSTSPNLRKNLLGTTQLGKLVVCPGCSPAGATINFIGYFRTASITPVAVSSQTCSDQTFAVSGTVAPSDEVGQVSWPGALGNLSVSAQVPSNNNILLHFCNPSAANVTPPAGVYRFFVFR